MLIIGLSLFPKSHCIVFSKVQILCSWLLGNNERLIISTCFPCFSQVKMDIFSILIVHAKLLMLIQDVKL